MTFTTNEPPPAPTLPEHPGKPLIHPTVAIIAIISAAILGITVVVFGGVATAALSNTNQQVLSQNSTLAKNNDALRKQVLTLGQTPVAPPSSQVVKNGVNGAAGATGLNGQDGVSVVSVQCTAANSWLVFYSSGRTQTNIGPCIAQDGAAGAPGAAGSNGADGANSTVPGPGGATGPAGQSPVSWTYMNPAGIPYTCTRTDPFDAANPTYSCAITPPTK